MRVSSAPVTAIRLENLSKSFRGLRALDGITAELPQGAVGLLGPNGAGKSTLVKCLLGLVKPSGGSGSVLGIDIASRPLELRQRIGYLPEVDCHIPGMSAVEFVAYTGELVGMPPRAAMGRAHVVLDYVGLADERYRLVHTYSAGMRQRVKLAQALVHDPELLFLDEPTNGLDPKGRELMLELVTDLSQNCGISLLYSSHLLADVEQVCDTVMILRAGRLVTIGSVAELTGGAKDGYDLRVRGAEEAFLAELRAEEIEHTLISPGRYTLFSRDNDSLPRRVLRAANTSGTQVRALRPRRTTLEDVFVTALEDGAI
jgi:ABC-2 type transport system ATP-binding protein